RTMRPRDLPRPRWDGSSLDGKTILVHPEQGLGDTLQFARYAKLLAERGARVFLECQEPLVKLFARCPGVSQVIPRGPTVFPQFDCHAPLLSLPLLCGTNETNIPAEVPYLVPDPARVAFWARELTGLDGWRVAIAWQGNPQHKGDRLRSVPLEMFE